MGRGGDSRSRPTARLPRIYRDADTDERSFRLDRWTAEFAQPEHEIAFGQRWGQTLRERASGVAWAASIVGLLLGLPHVSSSRSGAGTVTMLAIHLGMVLPLAIAAARPRRPEGAERRPFDYTASIALTAWFVSGFVVSVVLADRPSPLDIGTFTALVLASHLVVPNRFAWLAPFTAGASGVFLWATLAASPSDAIGTITLVTLVAATWAAATFSHRAIEISRRAEYMSVARAEHYGQQLEAAIDRGRQLEAELRRQVNVDPLTKVGNRRWFFEQMDAEFARSRRSNSPVSLIIVDADYFKRINDQHGHAAGDLALVHLTAIMASTLRTTDRLARIGGEEFAAIMPDTDLRSAHDVAERVRAAIAANPVLLATGTLGLTASIGVTTCEVHTEQPSQALARADHALYDAKRGGRDLVIAR